MSRPTVVTVCMFASSESWGLNSTHYLLHSCAGGGAVHRIITGREQVQQHPRLLDDLTVQKIRLVARRPWHTHNHQRLGNDWLSASAAMKRTPDPPQQVVPSFDLLVGGEQEAHGYFEAESLSC